MIRADLRWHQGEVMWFCWLSLGQLNYIMDGAFYVALCLNAVLKAPVNWLARKREFVGIDSLICHDTR